MRRRVQFFQSVEKLWRKKNFNLTFGIRTALRYAYLIRETKFFKTLDPVAALSHRLRLLSKISRSNAISIPGRICNGSGVPWYDGSSRINAPKPLLLTTYEFSNNLATVWWKMKGDCGAVKYKLLKKRGAGRVRLFTLTCQQQQTYGRLLFDKIWANTRLP